MGAIRQFCEAHFLTAGLRIHPLLILLAVYAGLERGSLWVTVYLVGGLVVWKLVEQER